MLKDIEGWSWGCNHLVQQKTISFRQLFSERTIPNFQTASYISLFFGAESSSTALGYNTSCIRFSGFSPLNFAGENT